jgi:predicted ATP-grasp superfamily ATP-dependent carboligase
VEHVSWTARPRLRRPALVAAFEGWNDAGDAASFAARFLATQCDAEQFAELDPEDFYDFTDTRPRVKLDDNLQREILWPANEFYAAKPAGVERDLIVVIGTEPQLRWKTFSRQIVGVARSLDASMVVTLGALLAEVAHSRPVAVVGTTSDPEIAEELGLRPSSYQGPTGIVGVLHDECRQAGLPSASLWAAVPAYVPSSPSPKAALALVERCSALLGLPVDTAELQQATSSYERQVSELVDADEETAAYVAELEQRTDDDPATELADGSALIEEVERFLRRQSPGD